MAIIYCPTCLPHAYQDRKYGPNKRVMNPTADNQHRCTVCNNKRSSSGAVIGSKKK